MRGGACPDVIVNGSESAAKTGRRQQVDRGATTGFGAAGVPLWLRLSLAAMVAGAGLVVAAPSHGQTAPPELPAEAPPDLSVTGTVRPAQPVIQRTERARRLIAARVRTERPATSRAAPDNAGGRATGAKSASSTYATSAAPGGIRIAQIPGATPRLGAADRRFHLAGIAVEGAPPALSGNIGELTASMVTRPVGVSDLFAAADFVQKALQAKGLTLSVVIVPDQVVGDGGTLRLKVTAPAYARLDLAGVPERLRALVEARLGGFIARGAPFDHAGFDSALFQLQEQTGLTFKAANAEQGSEAVIAVSAPGRLVSVEQTLSLGMGFPAKWATSLTTMTIHSPLGLGERIYGSGHLGLREELRLYKGPAHWGLVGINLPLGASGLALDLSYNQFYDRRRIRGPYDDFFGTETSRVLARLEYPLIMNRHNRLMLRLGLDGTRQSQFLIVDPVPSFDLWREDTRVARANAEWQMTLDNQTQIEALVEASQGLKGLGAGSNLRELAWSQTGAKAAFQKLEARFKARMPLGHEFTLEVSGRAQTSFGQALPSIEQISLLSYGSVRSLNLVTAAGETGAFGQVELARNLSLAETTPGMAGWSIEPYATAAVGMIRAVNKLKPDTHIISGHRVSTGIKLLGPMVDGLRSSELNIEGSFIRSTDTVQRQRGLSATWVVRF